MLHALIHVLHRGAARGDCAVMHTSINVLLYRTLSRTSFLYVTSTSLSYCKPAAASGPGALSDSPRESRCRQPVTAKPLRSSIIDPADIRCVEHGGQKETERETQSEDLFSKDKEGEDREVGKARDG